MAFIQPCFIRKNTSELINELEKIGYVKSSIYKENEYNLYIGGGTYSSANFIDGYYFDCGTNEELFIALASMTDNEYGLYDYYIVTDDCNPLYANGSIHRCLPLQSNIHPSCYRKAIVEELIEHFKEE